MPISPITRQTICIIAVILLVGCSAGSITSKDLDQAAMTHFRLAQQHMVNNNFAAALKEFNASLAIEPQNPHIHIEIGKIHEYTLKNSQAILAFDQAIELDPSLIDAYYYKGMLQKKSLDYREAINTFKQSVHANPTDMRGHYHLASLYRELNDSENMVYHYQAAYKIWETKLRLDKRYFEYNVTEERLYQDTKDQLMRFGKIQ